MSLREDVELYTKLSGEDGSQESIATIGAYLRGYAQGEEDAEPHWIPVTERLPEKGIDVLVTRKYDGREDGHKSCCYVEVASCFGQDDGVTWNSYSDEYKMHPRNHSVIAWMPLPEPYKGVTE